MPNSKEPETATAVLATTIQKEGEALAFSLFLSINGFTVSPSSFTSISPSLPKRTRVSNEIGIFSKGKNEDAIEESYPYLRLEILF